jgi:hypothetical protein
MDTRTCALPAPKPVRDLLSELLGRDVTVEISEPVQCGPQHPAMVAVYVDDTLSIRALAAADLPLSAHAGAAIGLVPKGGADASIEDGVLGQNLLENAREIFNIMASLFNQPDAAHVRMYADYAPASPLPNHVAVLAATLGQRLDLAVGIPGYGSGRLSLVVS